MVCIDRIASAIDLPYELNTSTCRSFVTISSALCLFFGILGVLHRLRSQTLGRIPFQGADQIGDAKYRVYDGAGTGFEDMAV